MRSIAAIAFAVLAGAAQAQMSEVIEVHVANVDVVVLDRAGKPITGLTKDDFQLFENGKPQPLTNFYEMRSQTLATPSEPAAAAPAPGAAEPSPEARKRSIIIFFDFVLDRVLRPQQSDRLDPSPDVDARARG